eukprot:3740127-Rhodomonas_salina.1
MVGLESKRTDSSDRVGAFSNNFTSVHKTAHTQTARIKPGRVRCAATLGEEAASRSESQAPQSPRACSSRSVPARRGAGGGGR